jgi:thioredoxin-like negative regulator of GroEL
LKVDVDEAQDIAQTLNITAMPTFFFYKRGKLVADVVGADQAKIFQLLNTYK